MGLSWLCLLACITWICEVKISMHPQMYLRNPWLILERFGANIGSITNNISPLTVSHAKVT